jgi:hypothetical protein
LISKENVVSSKQGKEKRKIPYQNITNPNRLEQTEAD